MARSIPISIILLSILCPSATWPVASDAPRWRVRITVSSREALNHPKPVAIEDLARLSAPPNVAKLDADYAKTRIPAFPNPYKLKEGDIVRMTGWVNSVAAEAGGAYLLSLSPGQAQGGVCVLAEIPDPDRLSREAENVFASPDPAVKEATPLTPLYRDARRTVVGSLLEDAPPQDGKSVAIAPTAVSVVGQLFYAGEPLPTVAGCRSTAAWEIAPVTEFRVARPGAAPSPAANNGSKAPGGAAQPPRGVGAR
ncbi:MAG TPA: hypothetical protein VGD08_02580 [Stellaceae bacterium]|jgi:hypothetical protein